MRSKSLHALKYSILSLLNTWNLSINILDLKSVALVNPSNNNSYTHFSFSTRINDWQDFDLAISNASFPKPAVKSKQEKFLVNPFNALLRSKSSYLFIQVSKSE